MEPIPEVSRHLGKLMAPRHAWEGLTSSGVARMRSSCTWRLPCWLSHMPAKSFSTSCAVPGSSDFLLWLLQYRMPMLQG